MKLYPAEGKILLKPLDEELDAPTQAHVGSIVAGNVVDIFGNTMPVGTIVVYPAYCGMRIRHDGETYVVMNAIDIYCFYKEDKNLNVN